MDAGMMRRRLGGAEIQTKSVVVNATFLHPHSQTTREFVARRASFHKGRSVPGRPFSYGASAIGVWFRVVAANGVVAGV